MMVLLGDTFCDSFFTCQLAAIEIGLHGGNGSNTCGLSR
jgi:hypothetical protein